MTFPLTTMATMDRTAEPVLGRAADEAARYLASLDERPVASRQAEPGLASRLPRTLPATGIHPDLVLDELIDASATGVVATGSPRYFGFVIGGAMPVAVAADWLTSAWDQNGGLRVTGPLAAELEDVAGRWLLDVLDLPATASYAFVTGCQMAHVTALAAARHHLLAARGWDAERQGLAGAPAVRVISGAAVHVTVPRALRLLGIGSD
jgi:glutamate/tyrosine decarboxylase-like PLP-dependent enzyme